MAITLTASTSDKIAFPSDFVLPAVSTTTGRLLVVTATWSSQDSMTISDTAGNTWTPVFGSLVGAYNQIWYCANATGNANNVITFARTTGNHMKACLMEFSGVATSSPLDTSATGTSSGAPCTTGQFTTAQANEVAVWGMNGYQGGGNITGAIDGSAGTRADTNDPTEGGVFYYILTSTKSNITASASCDNYAGQYVWLATFKEASAAAPPVTSLLGEANMSGETPTSTIDFLGGYIRVTRV